MERNPLPIIKEFLASSNDRQVRKNAVAALAAIETDEATVELVRTAAKDEDADTRRFAEEEILQLPADSLREAARELERELSDRVTTGPAYALLGRIRAHRVYVALPSLSLMRRFKLAWSLVRQLYPARGLAFRFRAMKKSLLVLSVSSLAYYLIAIGLLRVSLDPSNSIAFALLTIFAGAVLAFACTQRITPIGLQPDPVIAGLVQIGSIIFYSFLWTLVAAGITFSDPKVGSAKAVTVLLLLVPVACVIVRLATIGAMSSKSMNWLNRSGPIIAGGSAGCVLLTAAISNRWLYADTLIGGLWAVLVPSMFGLAAGFVDIDQTGPARTVVGRIRRWTSYGTIFLVLIAIVLASFSKGPVNPNPIIKDSGIPNDKRTLDIFYNPTVFPATLIADQTISVQTAPGTFCSTTISDSNAKTILSPVYGTSRHLPKGDYKLTVSTASYYRGHTPDDVLKLFNNQLMATLRGEPQSAPLCTIYLTLNVPDSHNPPHTP